MASRVTSALLVPVLTVAWLAPRPVEARVQPEGSSEAPPEPPSAEEQAVEQAQRLFDEGATKFETADYAGAIELWTEAFGLVPNVPEYAPIKAKLIANLAAAQERAYGVDGQVSHLNQARILIERYHAALDEIYLDEVEREKELAWVDERLSKIDAELKVVADREAAERAAAERAAAERAAADRASVEPRRPPGQGLMITGSVLTGLGVAGLGVMVGGMVVGRQNDDISDLPTNDLDTRADRFRMGRLGNTLAIAGGVGAGVLLGAGVALLVVGLQKRRAAGKEAAAITVAPTFGGGRVGVSLLGRF